MKFVRMTFDRILIKNSQNQLKQPKSVLISGNDSQKTETRNVICFEKKLNSLLSSVHLTKFLKLSLQGLQCLIGRWMSTKQEQKSKISRKIKMVLHNHKRLWTPLERRNNYEYGFIYCARFGFEKFKKMGENHLFIF